MVSDRTFRSYVEPNTNRTELRRDVELEPVRFRSTVEPNTFSLLPNRFFEFNVKLSTFLVSNLNATQI